METSIKRDFDIFAERIQLLWRSYCNRRIYKYFRNIIVSKLNGAPIDILKFVIPEEISLLDPSAGVHVRFRLGGSIFPPRILFKVFTHRPLCDLGAFAPRNYSLEKATDKFTLSKIAKSNRMKTVSTQIRVGARYFDANVNTTVHIDKWYKREENNPWRPIMTNKLDEILSPPWISSKDVKPPQNFHYNVLKRKEYAMNYKRQRKREWMMKAYKYAAKLNEVQNTIVFDSELERINTKNIANSSEMTDEMLNSDEAGIYSNLNDSCNIVPKDWKDDDLFFSNPTTDEDLIKWSLALSYSDYTSTWAKLGLSLPSDLQIIQNSDK